MVEKFYYLRRPDGNGLHRCGIVYLIKEQSVVVRGVSLCNHDADSFLRNRGLVFDRKKKEFVPFVGGLKKARDRAVNALFSGANSRPIKRPEAREKVNGFGFEFKSEYCPMLTEFERKILDGRPASKES